MGRSRWLTADLINASEFGFALVARTSLKTGNVAVVRDLEADPNKKDAVRSARVVWCVEGAEGSYVAGMEFTDAQAQASQAYANQDQANQAHSNHAHANGAHANHAHANQEHQPVQSGNQDTDLYEVLQLSPSAEQETIMRVYRILAQRYHPDNAQTGNSEMFLQLNEAYGVLSDPQRRAAYDARHRTNKQLEWKIFDRAESTTGLEAEKRKRQGILDLLHAKVLQDPERATMSVHRFEELLGCPREHLQAALWYLKGKGFVERSDNGRYTMTIKGFEQAELDAPTAASNLLRITASNPGRRPRGDVMPLT